MRQVELQGPSTQLLRTPFHLGSPPTPDASTRMGLQVEEGAPPIPSALEDTWGEGGPSPRGAVVDGLIHS